MIEKTLFNIPYYTLPTLYFKKKKQNLLSILKGYPEEKSGIQNFKTNKHLNRENLKQIFVEELKEELEHFSNKIKNDIIVKEVWSVLYEKNDYQSIHNHGTLGYYGILYLEYPDDGPTTEFLQPWNNIKNDKSTLFSYSPKEGDIIIVPSFVNHFSNPNFSDTPKRVISFDLKIK